MHIRQLEQKDYPQVRKIYEEGIATGLATFESSAPSWETWDKSHLSYGRIVMEDNGEVIGWASLAPVSSRCVYGGVAEVSVYVGEGSRGKGVGRKLLNELATISEENGLWTIQSGIMPGNKGSIELHKKCGFRTIGYREKVAKLNGEWMDNVLMERRSKVVGI